MRSHFYQVATAGLLATILPTTVHALSFEQPSCAEKPGLASGIHPESSSRCQDAILELYRWGATQIPAPPSDGCATIVTRGSCEIGVCNAHSRKPGSISAGALASAAQVMHAQCNENGHTGGLVWVDGVGDGSVLVMLGNMPHDELKKRELRFGRRAEPEAPKEPTYEVITSLDLPRLEARTQSVQQADGAEEGEEIPLAPEQCIEMAARLQESFMERTLPDVGPALIHNRRTPFAHGIYQQNGREVTIAVAYVPRDNQDLRRFPNPAEAVRRLLIEFFGSWRGGNSRSLFTSHVFLRDDANGLPDEPLGEFILNIRPGNAANTLLPWGSQAP